MSLFPSSSRRKGWIAASTSLVASCAISHAQDFTMMVTDPNPLGLGSFVPIAKDTLGIEGDFKGDFDYGVSGQAIYNSNFFQTETEEESEISGVITPWLFYTTDPEGGATFSMTANYMPSFRFYQENSDLNGTDQSTNVTLSFQKARTNADVFGRYLQVSATDRLTGEFVTGSVLTAGIRADRQLGSRTSISGGWTYGKSEYGSSDSVGTEVYTTSVGSFWAYTERVSFGPSIRYTVNKSDNIGTRKAWAVMMDARYRLGERVYLSAALGPEYSTFSEGSGDNESNLGVTGSLSASYMINERWSWKGSINSAVVPSPDQKDFVINNVAVTAGLQRRLLRGFLAGGIDANFSKYDDVGELEVTQENEVNVAIYLRYGRPFISDRIGFNTDIRYSLNDGENDWSQIQISAGLSTVF